MIDARIPLGYTGGFDAGQAIERAQAMKLRDMAMEQQTRQNNLAERKYATDMAASEQEARQKRLMTLARITNAATPENYGDVRRAAIAWGVDAAAIPEAYDENWVSQQKHILSIAADPQKMTAAMQNAEAMSGSPPGTPEFQKALQTILQPPRFVPVQPGGAVYVGDAISGTAQPAILPNDGTRQAGAPAGGGGVPPEAASMLQADPSPQAIREFNEVFGPGAAESILGGSSGNAGGGFQP